MAEGYMNRVIGEDGLRGHVTNGDGDPGRLEVCVSVGEFDDGMTIIEAFTKDGYEMLCLDFTAAHSLKMALETALNIHTHHMVS